MIFYIDDTVGGLDFSLYLQTSVITYPLLAR